MAIRARRRRQGGSPNRRTSRGRPSTARSGVGQLNLPRPTKPTVAKPTAQYQGVANTVPPPRAPVAGPSSTALRANAEEGMTLANTANRDAIWRAAMGLGDPTAFAKLQADPNFAGYTFTQDPNSIFAQLARQEAEGLEAIDQGANVGNTYFSGLRLDDRDDLTDETGRQRTAGTTAYLDDLREIAAILSGAQSQYRQAIADADQMDIDAALAMAPQYQPIATTPSGAPVKGNYEPGAATPKPRKKARKKKK